MPTMADNLFASVPGLIVCAVVAVALGVMFFYRVRRQLERGTLTASIRSGLGDVLGVAIAAVVLLLAIWIVITLVRIAF
jgi:uncharacterized membrane protein YidH (DUF202 family)